MEATQTVIGRWMGKGNGVSSHNGMLFGHKKKKRNEILQYATTGMNLKAPVPSEVSQAQKGKYRWFHFYGVHTTGKFKKAKSRMVGAGVQEERGGKLLSMVTKFQRCDLRPFRRPAGQHGP